MVTGILTRLCQASSVAVLKNHGLSLVKGVDNTEMLDGFIDDNVYCYKMNPDGSKGEQTKVVDPFTKDWDKFDRYRMTPKKNTEQKRLEELCCTQKTDEDEDMS